MAAVAACSVVFSARTASWATSLGSDGLVGGLLSADGLVGSLLGALDGDGAVASVLQAGGRRSRSAVETVGSTVSTPRLRQRTILAGATGVVAPVIDTVASVDERRGPVPSARA